MAFTAFPPAFRGRLQALWGDRLAAWSGFSSDQIRRVVRTNTLRIDPARLKVRLEKLGFVLEQVPFCPDAFFVSRPLRRSLGSTIEHSLGYFFVQDGASLLPVIALDPKPGETILDMAAAPGGKASHIAQLMQNKGALVCLDSSRVRLPGLRYSLARCGVINALVVFGSGHSFAAPRLFDRILLDAPCSCEGLGFSNPDIWKHWSETLVAQKAVLQKRLILRAFDLLKVGGTLVYSTCTLSPEENEFVIADLLAQRPSAQLAPLKFDGIVVEPGVVSWNGTKLDDRLKSCVRVYSPQSNTESFFVAQITKGVQVR